MNHDTHRTIYNQSRGCLIAVAETAKSSGKASGGSRPHTEQTRRKARFNWCLQGLQLAIALGLQAALLLPSSYAASTSQSQQSLQAGSYPTAINSALTRSHSERYAASQTGSGDESPQAACTRPSLFAASQSVGVVFSIGANTGFGVTASV